MNQSSALKPIESAPTDCDIIAWNSLTGPYRTRATTMEDGGIEWPLTFWGRPGLWYPKPTHWMPIDAITPHHNPTAPPSSSGNPSDLIDGPRGGK